MQKRLIPFINDKFPDGNYMFWPDLASAHYSNSVVDWMNENINFIPKDSNPPNVPQARPIEDFWSYLSQLVYENGWQAKSKRSLVLRIRSKLKKVDINYLQSIMKGVKGKLRKIADNGPLSLF